MGHGLCFEEHMHMHMHMRMDMGLSKPMTPRNLNRIKAKTKRDVSASVECVV